MFEFHERAELRELINITSNEEERLIAFNAYLKAYVTGIIDNIDSIEILINTLNDDENALYYVLASKIEDLKIDAWQFYENNLK